MKGYCPKHKKWWDIDDDHKECPACNPILRSYVTRVSVPDVTPPTASYYYITTDDNTGGWTRI